jgi:hypothetical protein
MQRTMERRWWAAKQEAWRGLQGCAQLDRKGKMG